MDPCEPSQRPSVIRTGATDESSEQQCLHTENTANIRVQLSSGVFDAYNTRRLWYTILHTYSQSEPRTSHKTGKLILLTYLYVAYQIKIRKIQ